MDPLSLLVIGLFIVAVPLVTIVAVVQRRRDKAPASLARVEVAPPPDEPRCPCGRPAIRSLPKYRVWEVPLFGRWVRREKDAFGAAVVCEEHAGVGAAIIDVQLAEAKLLEAQAQRAKLTVLANATADTLGAVVQSLPEERQKAYARSLRPATAVRVLKAVNGEESGDGQ